MSEPLLKIENLRTWFHTDIGVVKAVDGLNVEVQAGQTLGIVGESGSGKSVTSLSVMRLLPMQTARMEDGSKIYFEGENLIEVSDEKIRAIRGADISMIFQEPMTSLNPVYTTGNQVIEAIMLHQNTSYKEAEAKKGAPCKGSQMLTEHLVFKMFIVAATCFLIIPCCFPA